MVMTISGTPARGDVTVYRRTGVHKVFNGESQTAVERGNALVAALNYAQDGSVMELANGDFDIGTQTLDLSLGGTGSVHMKGAGRYATTIYTQSGGANASAAVIVVHPGSASEVASLTINSNIAAPLYSLPYGWKATDSVSTGALLRDVRIIGDSDCFYLRNSSPVVVSVENCELYAGYDTVNIVNLSGSHQVTFKNTKFKVVGRSATDSGLSRGVPVGAGTAYLYNCDIDISAPNNGGNDGTTYGVLAYGGTVYFYSGSVTTSNVGASAPLDLVRTSGTLYVNSGSVIYGSSKNSGTITELNQRITFIST